LSAVKWVLSNPDMHTACIGISSFDSIDRFMPLSGTTLARGDQDTIERYRLALADRYCRHGCTDCVTACPHATPVSTIMRYTYYFTDQTREKYAMTKYARLAGRDASLCESCSAPCAGACPHGVDIRSNLVRAHDLLTLI